MEIIKAYAFKNLCYIAARKMTPAGVVVHSTGANNPCLKRYVDCPEEVGVNAYGNHWNTATPEGRKVCVHAFIGYDKNKEVRVAEILPLNICCWGVGSGKNGSYNYSPAYIQFEICEDGLKDKSYYQKVFAVAAEYTAHLCKTYGLSVGQIVSHKEAHQKGYGNNHSDPEHWMKNFGETMDDFRNMVSEILKSKEEIAGNKQENTNAESATVGEISDGDLVSIVGNATYYSGKSIPDWVKKQRWYVKGTPTTDRVIIDRNESGTNSICSPIHRKYLTVVKAATTHNVFDSVNITACPYCVKITTDMLTIRQGAGTNTAKVGCITDRGVYTIVDEQSGIGASKWGKLKSGAGWISLDDMKRI